jgi:hypothetical protein
MIKFSLHCDQAHDFEGWFRSNEDYETQRKRGFVECPHCGSNKIDKALMAPAVSTSRKQEKMVLAVGAEQRQMMAEVKALTDKLKEGAENVGNKFAEEARKIHFGETEARGIYGEATPDQAKALAEDGVPFMPLPTLPEDRN